MRITLTSVLVDDQDKALRFYTEVLGFVKKTEVPRGSIAGSRSSHRSIPTGLSWCSSPTPTPPRGRSKRR
jgi:catechol 2,3-dioxygenase-like lactoylglutathione lyase family enzyme